jgi:hypothetical protein
MSSNVNLLTDYKLCPRCERTLPTSEFYIKKDARGGLYTYCKECSKARVREYKSKIVPQYMGDFKRCTRCGTVKHITEFHRTKRTKDGLQSWCKDCRKEYRKHANKKYKYPHVAVGDPQRFKDNSAHPDSCECVLCLTDKIRAFRDIKSLFKRR